MYKLSIITVLYNYPEWKMPTFFQSACKSFELDEIFIFRENSKSDQDYLKFISSNNLKESNYTRLFYYKIVHLRNNIIKQFKDNRLILFLDALDTDIITDKNDIVEKFQTFSSDIVIGAERNLWPPTVYSKLYNTRHFDTAFLNSGTFIGRRDALIHALDSMIAHGPKDIIDDQGAWTKLFLTGEAKIELDHHRRLFFNTQNSIELLNIIDGNFYGFKEHSPAIVHDNGSADPRRTFKLVKY